ncbi:MAG: hypothetical protein PHY80_04355 [Rickettsiales bacterium]|nr:hypothetical protein [Rickettsiales bacterium]
MNCNSYNTTRIDKGDNSYFLSIRDNDTDVLEEMYLSEKEFMILDTAIRHNRGMINLLSNVETIYGLFRKGLITISDDNLAVPKVSDVIAYILDPKIRADFTEDILLEENRPNGFFKLFGNKSICFCCL